MRVDLGHANVGVYSFSKIPLFHAQYMLDVTGFRDPQGRKEFRSLDGTDERIIAFMREDPRVVPILRTIEILTQEYIVAMKHTWFSIAFKDFHGRWISAAMAEITADYLSNLGYKVATKHHALDQEGATHKR